MNHSVRNNRSVNRLFSAMTGTVLKRNNNDIKSSRKIIKSALDDWGEFALEDSMRAAQRYIDKEIKGFNNGYVREKLSSFIYTTKEYLDGKIDDTHYLAYVANLAAYLKSVTGESFNQFYNDVLSSIETYVGKIDVPKNPNPLENEKPFTEEEIDDLYEGIVNTGDDRFYDWLYDTYDWVNPGNVEQVVCVELMLQWIYTHPEIYKEMREWLDYWAEEDND